MPTGGRTAGACSTGSSPWAAAAGWSRSQVARPLNCPSPLLYDTGAFDRERFWWPGAIRSARGWAPSGWEAPRMPCLRLVGQGLSDVFLPLHAEPTLLGKEPKCDIYLPDQRVSK